MPENVQSIMASVWLLVKFFFFLLREYYFAFSLSKENIGILENFWGIFHNAKISAREMSLMKLCM